MTRIASKVALAGVLLLSLGLSGCGYSLAGRGSFLPAYIKTIGLPLFVNNTPVFDVERRITEKVRAELIGRGRYTIKPDTQGVDAVLTGEIITIALAPAAINQQQQATRYSLTIVARIEFKDLKSGKILWSTPGMAFSEQYDVTSVVGGVSTDANAFLGQNVNALERLASEFARAVVSAILESF
jgi:outer membrane lipopolysaccharide assembly protein LptE/RlpB